MKRALWWASRILFLALVVAGLGFALHQGGWLAVFGGGYLYLWGHNTAMHDVDELRLTLLRMRRKFGAIEPLSEWRDN
jgi:hypothetical protein